MEKLKDFIGCRCHAQASWGFKGPDEAKAHVPAHTFPWATLQYPEERPVIPTTQSLDLVLDIDKEELSGSNTIQIRAQHKEVSSFKVDAVDLQIHDVQFNKKSVKFSVGAQATEVNLSRPLQRGDVGELKIVYSVRKPKAGLYFIKPDKEYPQRPVQVWTQGQDDDARFWFPSFDEPRIKCAFDLKVEVPSGFIATSNGALHSETRGGKTWTFHWKTSFAIPSYLATLTVGRFSEIKEDWKGKPVVYLCEKGREDEARVSFGKTPQMIDHFSQILGVDYPYEKYTQVAVSEFIFGGMENTSATTQTDSTLHPYEIEEDYSSDDLVSHELAHQWFGDLVTCKTWWHGWLNEGWATFMETVFKEHDRGRDENDYYRYELLEMYLGEDRGLYRRPIVTNFFSDPGEVWDRHTYEKGALVLNTLKGELGDEDFWAGTRHYLQTHKGGIVETVDFQRAMEQVSGRSLQEFFDQWIYKSGYPELKIGFTWDDKTRTAEVKFEQKQNLTTETPVFKLNSEIEFILGDGKKLAFPVALTQKEQNFYFHLDAKPSYCRFDVGNKILKTLEWAIPLEMAKEQLKKDGDVVGKIWAMKQLAKDASKEGVEALVDRLRSDKFWGLRAEAATCLGEARTEEALKALVSALNEEGTSKVRTKICAALGEFRDERAGEALMQTLEKDKSLFVKGAAASSLGKTKSPKAFDALKGALRHKTWNDWLAGQVYNGLKQLRDERALDLFLSGAQYGAPKFSRIYAVAGLGEYGLNRPDVTEFLQQALSDPYFRVRFFAAEALVKRKDPTAVGSLEETGHRANDGHLKAAVFRAARRLRDGLQRPEELNVFKESLDKLSDENRKLKDRLQRLEEQNKTH